MRFQERDGQLLQTLHDHDGVMARRQLKMLFWPEKSSRAMEKRLAKLHRLDYLAWPTANQRRTRPIPEPVVWLAWKGIYWLAGQGGSSIAAPRGENENQLRKLEMRLREQGIHWVREPRWAQLQHDLAVVDFRLAVEQAAQQNPAMRLEEWVNESTFRSRPDPVEFVQNTNGYPRPVRRKVIPDGYFSILHGGLPGQGPAARSRFLLEVDLSSHNNRSFGRQKVLPGLAYLLSPAYRKRFGDNSGRWLVVTTGERRMRNLKRQAEVEAPESAATFYFTVFDQVRPETIFVAPIWHRGADPDPHSLFEISDIPDETEAEDEGPSPGGRPKGRQQPEVLNHR